MDDLIRRSDAIRVASGYCHWSNIPDELAKLPSVGRKRQDGGRMTREEAIEVIKQDIPCEHDTDLIEALEMAIKALEQTRWIPVSEKLPEDGTYLICTDDGYIATIMYDCSMGWLLDANIIAYMPLPQPYKGESE